MNIPTRGFEVSEYENRLDKIQKLMAEFKMDVILLTTQVDIEYYTGFKTQFFQFVQFRVPPIQDPLPFQS